jgi:hypothetical protein
MISGSGSGAEVLQEALASKGFEGHFHRGSWHLSRFMVVSAMEAGIYRDLWSFPPWKLASIEIYGRFHHGSRHLSRFMVVSTMEMGI